MILAAVDRMLKRLFSSAKLRGYEIVCLEAWKRHLSDRALAVLERQLSLYDLVQRLSKDKLVSFHCLADPSYSAWPQGSRFLLQSDERVVCSMRLRPKDSRTGTEMGAAITVFRGRLSSIEFDKPPTSVFPRHTETSGVEVMNVKVLADPMEPEVYSTDQLVKIGDLSGWARMWAERWGFRGGRKPLGRDEQRQRIGEVDAMLPLDYLELATQAEGLKLRNCVVYGLSEIRRIVRPDANFYVLAEIEGQGSLAVRQGANALDLLYLDNEDERPVSVGHSFREAVESRIAVA